MNMLKSIILAIGVSALSAADAPAAKFQHYMPNAPSSFGSYNQAPDIIRGADWDCVYRFVENAVGQNPRADIFLVAMVRYPSLADNSAGVCRIEFQAYLEGKMIASGAKELKGKDAIDVIYAIDYSDVFALRGSQDWRLLEPSGPILSAERLTKDTQTNVTRNIESSQPVRFLLRRIGEIIGFPLARAETGKLSDHPTP